MRKEGQPALVRTSLFNLHIQRSAFCSHQPQQSVLNRQTGQRQTACIRNISAPQRSHSTLSASAAVRRLVGGAVGTGAGFSDSGMADYTARMRSSPTGPSDSRTHSPTGPLSAIPLALVAHLAALRSRGLLGGNPRAAQLRSILPRTRHKRVCISDLARPLCMRIGQMSAGGHGGARLYNSWCAIRPFMYWERAIGRRG